MAATLDAVILSEAVQRRLEGPAPSEDERDP